MTDLRKKIVITEIIAVVIGSGLGALFHFVFEWCGNPLWLAPFVPINESVWEHLKIIFYPLVLTAIGEYFILGKTFRSFIGVKATGIWLAMAFTVVAYFAFDGIWGRGEVMAVTFVIYFLAYALEAWYFITRLPLLFWAEKTRRNLIILGLFLTAAVLCVFSFVQPHIGLFFDPSTKTFGLPH